MRITLSGLNQDNFDEVVCLLDEAEITREIQFPYAGTIGLVSLDFDDMKPFRLFDLIKDMTAINVTITFAEKK